MSSLLRDPERLREGIEAMIEQKRAGLRGHPEREVKLWHDKLAEADRKRGNFQDMAAEGLITFDELREKLTTLQETRKTAQRELEALSQRWNEIEELEHDRDSLLESYRSRVPGTLDVLTPEERQRVYKMIRLQVVLRPDAPPKVSGVFKADLAVSELETASRPRSAGS